MSMTPEKEAMHFTGQAQKLVRLTASGIFDRRIGEKGAFFKGLDTHRLAEDLCTL